MLLSLNIGSLIGVGLSQEFKSNMDDSKIDNNHVILTVRLV
jgi:hypothetical protein